MKHISSLRDQFNDLIDRHEDDKNLKASLKTGLGNLLDRLSENSSTVRENGGERFINNKMKGIADYSKLTDAQKVALHNVSNIDHSIGAYSDINNMIGDTENPDNLFNIKQKQVGDSTLSRKMEDLRISGLFSRAFRNLDDLKGNNASSFLAGEMIPAVSGGILSGAALTSPLLAKFMIKEASKTGSRLGNLGKTYKPVPALSATSVNNKNRKFGKGG
jgi:hypothetical protein